MKTILMMAIMLFPIPVAAGDAWTTKDTALQATFLTLMAIDRGQTQQIVDHPERYREAGFAKYYTGEHPTTRKINEYALGVSAFHTAVAYMLPKKYRTAWQLVFIGIEVNTVKHNISMGIGVRF